MTYLTRLLLLDDKGLDDHGQPGTCTGGIQTPASVCVWACVGGWACA